MTTHAYTVLLIPSAIIPANMLQTQGEIIYVVLMTAGLDWVMLSVMTAGMKSHEEVWHVENMPTATGGLGVVEHGMDKL